VYNGELPYTNYTADFKGIIDYIFYSTDGLAPVKVLGPIPDDVMDTFDGCPNPHFPSDHLPLFAEMALTRVVQPAEVKS
jgi:CCR4-NOT transcription complex subunit 6